MDTWYAIIADQDILYSQANNPNPDLWGKVEYTKGSVVSYGSNVNVATLPVGLRAVSIGNVQPDFSQVQWDPITETLVPVVQGVV